MVSVGGMNLVDALIAQDRAGIAIVADAASASVSELVARGMDRDRAEQLHLAAEVFYGSVRSTKAQAACVAAARENAHRLDTLAYIARSSRSLDSDKDRWHYRQKLCETQGDLRTVMNRAKALKKELKPPAPRAPKASVTFHDKGWSTVHITGRTTDVLPVYRAAKDDPQAWLNNTRGTGEASVTTVLNMDIGDFIQWRMREDGEIEVQLTNGEWLRGAELVNRKLRAAGYIALISATDGPVNLYPVKLERHANRELRALMSADGATCAWAGCNQPADFSEAHHIQEWSKGGATEIGNMCWLCTYHNRQNSRPNRGRMQRVGGQIMWQSPKGYLTPRGIKHTDPAKRNARLAHIPATGPP